MKKHVETSKDASIGDDYGKRLGKGSIKHVDVPR